LTTLSLVLICEKRTEDVPRTYDSFHPPFLCVDAILVPSHLNVMKSMGILKRNMENLKIEYERVYFHK
jgi:hypothetical protein